MSHPIRPSSFVKIANFYTATVYNKGAEVIRMMHTLLGVEGFRKGTDKYFECFDGQAVTTEDFVEAMASANDYDFSKFKNWYNQSGTPTVKASGTYNAGEQTYTLTLSQVTPASTGQEEKKPFVIPVRMGLLNENGEDLPLYLKDGSSAEGQTSRVLVLEDAEQSFLFHEVKARPIPSLFRHFSAPIKLEAEYTIDQLQFLLANDSDFFNRWDAGQNWPEKFCWGWCVNGRRVRISTLSPASSLPMGNCWRMKRSTERSWRKRGCMPSESEIGHAMDEVDVEGQAAREHMRVALALAHEKQLLLTYESLRSDGGTSHRMPWRAGNSATFASATWQV